MQKIVDRPEAFRKDKSTLMRVRQKNESKKKDQKDTLRRTEGNCIDLLRLYQYRGAIATGSLT